MSLERLKKLKSALETQKQEKAKVEGQLEAAMEQLLVLGYSTLPEAEKAVAKMDDELDKLDLEIGSVVRELETKYASII